jgi:uncharacterized protein YyaL (SSP411 family)
MKKPENKKYNRLIDEKSPYLLQHASNPVDWYPWSDEAFSKAEAEDKPIFLSIGYSTCHWCHVMERESFEDHDVAKLLNENFVSIKVDREERPDIDDIYMTVCQIMSGSGGWPLTIIMTPDKEPFFAGTYFPKQGKYGRAGLLDILPKIVDFWENKRAEALNLGNKIKSALNKYAFITPGETLDKSVLELCFDQLKRRYDSELGGFGKAPKFPAAHNLLFLLRYWKAHGDAIALEMVEKTLIEMRKGGIYDHLGFGFHRYSTDRKWLIPHFEKMLYDQAMLALVYLEAFQATQNPMFADTAEEIFRYVLRDMTSDEGGFYSAEDADSEGEEGKFYLWRKSEIEEVLEENQDYITDVFNIEETGNFVDPMKNQKTGENILHLKNFSAHSDVRFESVRKKLFEYREKRIHPHKDDKILTDWNGLMIAALSKGANVLDKPEYAKAAQKAVDFITENLQNQDNRVLHRFRDGDAAIDGQIDDYAFLVFGLLELYEATFQPQYLEKAIALMDTQLEYFWDDRNGGFYSVAHDAEKLLVRKKEIYDGAMPSGNSVSLMNLIRLGRLTANLRYENKANELSKAFSDIISDSPNGYTYFLSAMNFILEKSYEIVIIGEKEREDTQKLLAKLREHFIPNKVVLLIPEKTDSSERDRILRLAEFVRHYKAINEKATVYVCHNFKCELPITQTKTMLEVLGEL